MHLAFALLILCILFYSQKYVINLLIVPIYMGM